MTFKRWWWWLLPLAFVVAGAAWWWSHAAAGPKATYRSAPIERGALQATVSASGTVNPVSQVTVGSQVSGQIKELYADFNTRVAKGQPIARIDPESFRYRLRQAQADVEAARAAVLNAQANAAAVAANVSRAKLEAANAQDDLRRRQQLLAQNFISQTEYENVRNNAAVLAEALKVAQAQLDVARAQVASAQAVVRQREASMAQSQVDLERTEIRSPVDGVVIRRAVDVGQTVAASLQAPELFVIARNLSDMQVEASIDEADISRVRPQQKVSFTIDAFPGRTFEGQVSQVRKAAVSQQNVVTYTVVVPFANPGNVLLPGMTANVRIVTDNREQVLKVPNAALRLRLPDAEAAAAPASAGNGRTAAALPANPEVPAVLRELRDRMAAELSLGAEQLAAVDGIVNDSAARFAELRKLPQSQRGAAREQLLSELRTRMGEQLTPAQREAYQQLLSQAAGRGATRGRLYTLDADGKPVAWAVRLGVSDGAFTELMPAPAGSPQADVLKEGTPVVVAVENREPAGGRAAGGGPRAPQF